MKLQTCKIFPYRKTKHQFFFSVDNVCNSDDYVLQTETIKRFSAGTKTMDEARPEENRLSNALLKIRLSG